MVETDHSFTRVSRENPIVNGPNPLGILILSYLCVGIGKLPPRRTVATVAGTPPATTTRVNHPQ